jgi:O-methyltransferase
MRQRVRSVASRVLGRAPDSTPPEQPPQPDVRATMSDDDRRIVERALPYTMTGVPRLLALVDAVRYCVRGGIGGDFAECGVWRGGSVIAMIETLKALGDDGRDIHLYDTFEGMTEPTEHDTSAFAPPAMTTWDQAQGGEERPWSDLFGDAAFNEEQVRRALLSTGYPLARLHIVRGRVEDTLPSHLPERIALLRLDTDWYESTRLELELLYPRLVSGGVLVIDDYGHWDGCRRAVDEYFESRPAILMNRIDYTGRIAVKP